MDKQELFHIRLFKPKTFGPLVKRLRHRPFTAVTGVRIPQGSPFLITPCGLVVQLVRMPACHAGGREFESLPGRHFYLNITKLCDPLAQLVEHLTFNQGVGRSSRPWVTIFLFVLGLFNKFIKLMWLNWHKQRTQICDLV